MKKIVSLLLVCFLFTGCSQQKTEDTVQAPALLDIATIETNLQNTGWVVQDTTAASFHLWEQLNPASLVLAEDSMDEVLIIGIFPDEDTASLAYQSTVPLSDDHVSTENSDLYNQAMITMTDGNGYWLFRQMGTSVTGAWMADSSSESEFSSLFDSFARDPSVFASDDTSAADQSEAAN